MKRLHFVRLFLIAIIAVSLVAFFRAIYDDDDATFDVLCNNNDFLLYTRLLFNPASYQGRLYEYNNVFIYPEAFISYLASKEKSPPVNPILFLAA